LVFNLGFLDCPWPFPRLQLRFSSLWFGARLRRLPGLLPLPCGRRTSRLLSSLGVMIFFLIRASRVFSSKQRFLGRFPFASAPFLYVPSPLLLLFFFFLVPFLSLPKDFLQIPFPPRFLRFHPFLLSPSPLTLLSHPFVSGWRAPLPLSFRPPSLTSPRKNPPCLCPRISLFPFFAPLVYPHQITSRPPPPSKLPLRLFPLSLLVLS